MLGSVKITLMPPAGQKLLWHFGSLFHGYLMEIVLPSLAQKLHRQGLKPYSQHLEQSADGNWLWQINSLTNEAWEGICLPLLDPEIDKIVIRDKNWVLKIIQKEAASLITYNELVKMFYLEGGGSRQQRVKFLTPASFKSDGLYVNLPQLNLIYQSLSNRFDAFAGEFATNDPDALEHIVRHTLISNYKLKSAVFALEGVYIPSFVGEMNLKIKGPEMLANLANLLLYFGNWSGVGIKSSLGMGALKVEAK